MDFYNVTHLSYSNAGIDTDTIVQKLMQAEQVPLNQLKQKQQKDLWLSDAYRQWNTSIFSFNNDTVFNMKLSASYDTFNVNSSVANSVTGTATASAVPGSYKLVVNSLAKSANLTGTNQSFDPTKTLGLQTATQALASNSAFNISVVSDPSKPTVVQTATINIHTGDMIGDVLASLNNAKDATGKSLGINAYYDSNMHQFIVKTNATGQATNITLTAADSAATNFLSTTLGISNVSGAGTVSAGGGNANIIFSDNSTGNQTTITNLTSNTVNLMGVNYNLVPTDSNGTTITVSRNVDNEVKNIEDFISKYNDLLSKLNSSISEPVYSSYQPLTDDQKSQMTDTQIQQWETKAKSGLMHNDSILTGVVSKMRSAMSSFVNNGSSYNSLSSIGISSRSYQDQGKLYVDETKLRAALQNDPNGVKNLFSQIGNGVGNQGVVQSLSESLNDAFIQLVNKAGSTSGSQYDQSFIGRDLTSLQTRISDMTTRLQQKETSYYKQYDAMQSAVSKFQSQSSWLSQQLGMSTTNG